MSKALELVNMLISKGFKLCSPVDEFLVCSRMHTDGLFESFHISTNNNLHELYITTREGYTLIEKDYTSDEVMQVK